MRLSPGAGDRRLHGSLWPVLVDEPELAVDLQAPPEWPFEIEHPDPVSLRLWRSKKAVVEPYPSVLTVCCALVQTITEVKLRIQNVRKPPPRVSPPDKVFIPPTITLFGASLPPFS